MGTLPFENYNYPSHLKSKSMVQIPPVSMPPTNPMMLPFGQMTFPVHHQPFPSMPFNTTPVSLPQWNPQMWNAQMPMTPVPPPFPASFMNSPMTSAMQGQASINGQLNISSSKSNQSFLPTNSNLSQWPTLPSCVPTSKCSPLSNKYSSNLPVHSRAISAPPPIENNNHQSHHTIDPFAQLGSQLHFLIDKIVPLNFDSTSSRIRKLLVDRQVVTTVDQFNEAVRVIVDYVVSNTDEPDVFALYCTLIRSLSKLDYYESEEAKPTNFLNSVVNRCFSILNIRSSQSSHDENKYVSFFPPKIWLFSFDAKFFLRRRKVTTTKTQSKK